MSLKGCAALTEAGQKLPEFRIVLPIDETDARPTVAGIVR